MAVYDAGPVSIHYDDEGDPDGFPVLLIAPGGMRSANEIWATTPWNPRERLAPDGFRLIGMDQRNAGRSHAPVSAGDGWATYAGDQLALLDHLGVERCHLVGMCIGGPYIVGLLRRAPERFASAVLLQPVGIDDNRAAFHDMFDQWVDTNRDRHPDVGDDVWNAFRGNMWDGEFVLTATPEEVAAIATPMLVAMGNDLYHPQATSRLIVERAPAATLVEEWKDGDALAAFDPVARDFLSAHTPG